MAGRQDILSRVRRSVQGGARFPALFDSLEVRDFRHAYPIVRGYILDRFLLMEEPAETDCILDLADISLRHILALKKAGLYVGDTSRACSAASSVIAKKVLLMKAIQQDFRVEMTPAQAAELSTVTDVTRYILAQRG